VDVAIDPAIDALGKDKIVFRITLTMQDGTTHSEESDRHYRGGPQNPLTDAEVADKFRDAAQYVLDADSIEAFLALTGRFESLSDLDRILDTVTV